MSEIKKAQAMIKRDKISAWQLAKNYIPNVGVIIVMDDNEGNIKKLCLGDGKTLVNELPNLLEQTNNKNNNSNISEPSSAPIVEEKVLKL